MSLDAAHSHPGACGTWGGVYCQIHGDLDHALDLGWDCAYPGSVSLHVAWPEAKPGRNSLYLTMICSKEGIPVGTGCWNSHQYLLSPQEIPICDSGGCADPVANLTALPEPGFGSEPGFLFVCSDSTTAVSGSPIKQMKRLQWVLEACPATSTEPKPCQNYKECAMMVLETKALELTWKCSRSGWMALWATALYLVSATIHPQWTAFFLLCLSRLNFKPAKAIVTTWVLVPIVSCNLMVCLPTDCIIFSHSFKFNSLIISLFLL